MEYGTSVVPQGDGTYMVYRTYTSSSGATNTVAWAIAEPVEPVKPVPEYARPRPRAQNPHYEKRPH